MQREHTAQLSATLISFSPLFADATLAVADLERHMCLLNRPNYDAKPVGPTPSSYTDSQTRSNRIAEEASSSVMLIDPVRATKQYPSRRAAGLLQRRMSPSWKSSTLHRPL